MKGIVINGKYLFRETRREVERNQNMVYIELQIDPLIGQPLEQGYSEICQLFVWQWEKQHQPEYYAQIKDLPRDQLIEQLYAEIEPNLELFKGFSAWQKMSPEEKGTVDGQVLNAEGTQMITVPLETPNPHNDQYFEAIRNSYFAPWFDQIVTHLFERVGVDTLELRDF